MLYKIDYTRRSDLSTGSKWVNHAADKTEAIKRFLAAFFKATKFDGIRIDLITEVEIIGDLSDIDLIDEAVAEK